MAHHLKQSPRDAPPHTSNPFDKLPETVVTKLLRCLGPFCRAHARLTCTRLRSAADELVARVLSSPTDNFPFRALAALPVRFPAASELELWPDGFREMRVSRTGAQLELLLLPHLEALPDGALRQITRLTGREWHGLTPRLLAQLGRVCPMLLEIVGRVERLATCGGTEAGGTEAGGTEAGGTEAGGTEAGGTERGGVDAAQQLAAAASQSGAACDASPYLASLEVLEFWPKGPKPIGYGPPIMELFSDADAAANAAAIARLTSLRRLTFGNSSPEILLGPPALASTTLTALDPSVQESGPRAALQLPGAAGAVLV